MTNRDIILGAAVSALLLLALLITACSAQQQAALQTAASSAVAQVPPLATHTDAATPEFSALVTPTPAPTLAGPMGTLTAIADLVASPTPDREPYVIENRGRPHFIEFHAWW